VSEYVCVCVYVCNICMCGCVGIVLCEYYDVLCCVCVCVCILIHASCMLFLDDVGMCLCAQFFIMFLLCEYFFHCLAYVF